MKMGKLWLLAVLTLSAAHAAPPKAQLSVKATAPALQESSGGESPTFESKNAGKTFFLGLLPHDKPEAAIESVGDDVKVPGKYDLDVDWITAVQKLQPCDIYDQGQCGSCVYNSVSATHCGTHRARGKNVPVLSRQWAMDCAQRQWMCDGSLGEYVAKGISDKGGQPAESDYQYRASNQSCRGTPALAATLKGYKVINGTPRDIANEIANNKKPVSITVAASGNWSGYSGGIYNGCDSMSTNHQVVIDGYDCETSVDAAGNCVFNSAGYPANGDGFALVRNSWGTRWGVNGKMKSRWLGRSGQKCNALAEEALVLDTGEEPKPPTPPTPPTPPVPPPTPFALQGWMIYVGLGLLALIVVLQLMHNVSVARKMAQR